MSLRLDVGTPQTLTGKVKKVGGARFTLPLLHHAIDDLDGQSRRSLACTAIGSGVSRFQELNVGKQEFLG